MQTTTTTATLRRATRPWTMACICAAAFLAYLDMTIINIALPRLATDLHATLADLEWVINSYTVCYAGLLLAAGTLADRWGRKRLFLSGVALFALASLGCALAPGLGLLITARLAQGVASAILIPVSMALVAVLHPEPAERAHAIGLYAGGVGLALVAGPLIGGPLVDLFGWRSVFWINLPITVPVFWVLLRTLAETRDANEVGIDLPGQALFFTTLTALTAYLIEGNRNGWTSGSALGPELVAVAALLGFVARERRAAAPMLPLGVFRNPVLVAACLVNLFSIFGVFAALFVLTLFDQTLNGLDARTTGLRFLAMTAAILLASVVAPRVAQRSGARAPVALGSLAAAIGFGALTALQPGQAYANYAWALALIGIGVSFAGPPSALALLASVPARHAGLASALASTSRQIGGIAGVAAAGALLPHGTDPTGFVVGMHHTFMLACAGCLLGAFCALYYQKSRPKSTTPARRPGSDQPA